MPRSARSFLKDRLSHRCQNKVVDSTTNDHSEGKPYLFSTGSTLALTDDDPGVYDFAVLLGQIASTKNKWAYSRVLNKLYTVWHQVIPLEFRWMRDDPDLWVRAQLLYTDVNFLHKPVQRCAIHMGASDPTNKDISYVKHIIRSENPGAIYEENPDQRCSVIVPLGEPQPGTGTVTVTYKFMCKTSCVAGMTRRPMAVLFTLERSNGEVLGKQTMGLKVCSCPRRDMDKEEQMMKRQLKKKYEEDSDFAYRLEIAIPDLEMYKKVLEFNHGGVTSLLRTTPHTDPRYTQLNECLTSLEEKLSYFSQWES